MAPIVNLSAGGGEPSPSLGRAPIRNMVIQWQTDGDAPLVERIVWLDPSGGLVATIDIFARAPMPEVRTHEEVAAALRDGEARAIKDPYASLIPSGDGISEAATRARDKALDDIAPLIEDTRGVGRMFTSKGRGALLSHAQARTTPKRSLNTLLKHWRRWLQRGMKGNVLLPDFHDRGVISKDKERAPWTAKADIPRTYRPFVLTGGERELLVKGLKEMFEVSERPPFTKAYDDTIAKYFNDSWTLVDGVWVPIIPDRGRRPSIDQARYWYAKKADPEQAYRRRFGARRYNLRMRALDGNTALRLAIGPGSLAEFDSTPGDVDLALPTDRNRSVGRPTIYTLIDVFSRRIMAILATLDAASYLCALMTLEIAGADKVAYCRSYGVVDGAEEWADCVGLPERVLADRGEMEGYKADALADNLGVYLGNTAAGRADYKPVVERDQRSTKEELVRWLVGAKDKHRERGDPDTARGTALTLHEFTGLLLARALHHNRAARVSDEHLLTIDAIDADVKPYPNDLWAWGMEHRNGGLKVEDPDVIRLNLLPTGTARSTENGVRFSVNGRNKLLYTGDTPQKETWAGKARLGGAWDVEVAYHPHRADVVYLRLDKGRRLEPLVLKDAYRRYAAMSWFEMDKYWEARGEARGAELTREMQSRAELDARIGAANTAATAAKKAAGVKLSDHAIRKGWRKNRREAQQADRPGRSWLPVDRQLGGQPDSDGATTAPAPADAALAARGTDRPAYVRVVRDDALYDGLFDDDETRVPTRGEE